MSVIGTIVTTVKQGSGDEVTYTPIVCGAYTCKRTSIVMPYRLVASLTDDEFAATIGDAIIAGATIDLDDLMRADDAINMDEDYLRAREREMPDLVRYDKKSGAIRPRTTTPAAFVRRFIVPAIEGQLTAEVVAFAGIDTETVTPAHLANLVKSIATTEVTDKVKHYTRGTSNADKAAHMTRKQRRAAHK